MPVSSVVPSLQSPIDTLRSLFTSEQVTDKNRENNFFLVFFSTPLTECHGSFLRHDVPNICRSHVLDIFDTYCILLLWSRSVASLCVHKGQDGQSRGTVWANSLAAACRDGKQRSWYNPYVIHLKELSGAACHMQEVGLHTGERKLHLMGNSGHAFQLSMQLSTEQGKEI